MKNDANRHTKNALINILLFPGVGSLKSGRVGAGMGQLVLVLAGCAFLLAWFFKVISEYYSLMFGDVKPQAIGWMGGVGGVLFVIAWLWSCVTSISLFQEASKASKASQVSQAGGAAPPVLPPSQSGLFDATIQAALTALPAWRRQGQAIVRTYEFKDFPDAVKFVNAVAALAEQAQHHPDIDVRWNKVTLVLTTHDAGGITEKDFALARECDGRFAG